jgi:hypothetical protein
LPVQESALWVEQLPVVWSVPQTKASLTSYML